MQRPEPDPGCMCILVQLRQMMIGGSQRSKEDWEKQFQLSDGKNMNALMELG